MVLSYHSLNVKLLTVGRAHDLVDKSVELIESHIAKLEHNVLDNVYRFTYHKGTGKLSLEISCKSCRIGNGRIKLCNLITEELEENILEGLCADRHKLVVKLGELCKQSLFICCISGVLTVCGRLHKGGDNVYKVSLCGNADAILHLSSCGIAELERNVCVHSLDRIKECKKIFRSVSNTCSCKKIVDLFTRNIGICGELLSYRGNTHLNVRIEKVVVCLHIRCGYVDRNSEETVNACCAVFTRIFNKSNAVLVVCHTCLFTVNGELYKHEHIIAGLIYKRGSTDKTVALSLKGKLNGSLVNAYYEIVDGLEELLVAIELEAAEVAGRGSLGSLCLTTA